MKRIYLYISYNIISLSMDQLFIYFKCLMNCLYTVDIDNIKKEN